MAPKKLLVVVIIILAIVATAAPSYYFYSQYQRTQRLLKNPTEAAKEENNQIIAQIGKLADLPMGEDPTVATISDRDKLAGQPFFARALNGDKVLFYNTAKKAILYRPATNKIIEMSQVNINESPAPTTKPVVSGASTQILSSPFPTTTPQPVSNIRVAILNGTTTPKLANNVEKTLTDKFGFVAVVKKDNAAKQDYAKTIVIDLLGSQTINAKSIAAAVSGDVSTLPGSEPRPNDADILVIIGKNYVAPK
jgi:hypothetical protein